MRVCASLLLLGICAYTHCFASNTPSDSKRSVNLALETVLEFNDKDKASDIKFLDNVQNFITKVKTVIDKNSNVKTDFRRDFKMPIVDTFTDFIRDAVKILNTYDNTTLKDFFDILDEEIRKYHYRGCKFYELMENYEIRKMIAAKLDSFKKQPAAVIKADINSLSETLTNVNHDKNIIEIVDYINSLYRQDAREQLQKVLSDLEAHGKAKSKTNLREVIKNAVRSIVFDHYTNLNTNVRRDVKQNIENFWKRFKPKANTSDNINNEVKKPKLVSRKHTANIDVKQSDYKGVGMKRDNMKLEKKRYKHTRKDTIDGPLKSQEKVKKIPPQYTGSAVQQRIKTKHQEESSDGESLEFYQEPKDNTQQNKVTHSKIKSQKLIKTRKQSKKFKPVNLTTRSPTDNTKPNIWIEESTGRLPKAVLDKLANKPSGHEALTRGKNKHGPKHGNKYGKGKKSWHGKMYEPNHAKTSGKRYNKKHVNEHIRKHQTKYDSQSTHDSRQTSSEHIKHKTMELYQHKKSMGSFNVELIHANRSSAVATKTPKFLDVDVLIPAKSGKTIKPPRGARTAAKKKLAASSRAQRMKHDDARRMESVEMKHSKKNQILSRKSESLWSNEGTTEEELVSELEEKPKHQSQQTIYSLEKDLYVIKKIKHLEKELEEVKSRLNDKTKVKHSESKEKQAIRDLSETRTRSDGSRFINDSKPIQKKHKTLNNETVVNIIENKHVQQITSKHNDTKDNIKKDKSNVNADKNNKVTKLPQSSKPSKSKSKLSEVKPLRSNKLVVNSKPKPNQTEITGTADNKTVVRSGKTDKSENGTSKANGDIVIAEENINDSKPKQKKHKTLETLNNETVDNIIENKHVQQITSKHNDTKDNIKKDKSNVNADKNNKVTKLPQSSKPSKSKSKLSEVKPLRSNKLVVNSKPKPNQTEITGTADNKAVVRNGKTDKSENGTSKTNGDIVIAKENINGLKKKRVGLLQITGTANNDKKLLNEPVTERDPKLLDNGNTDNKTNTFPKGLHIINNKDIKKGRNANRNSKKMIEKVDYLKMRKESLQVTKTTNVTKNILNKPIKEKDFKSIDKNINSKSNFSSDSNITSKVFRSEKPDMTKLANNSKDKDSKNNEVKDNIKDKKIKQLPPPKDPNKGKTDFTKTRPKRPNTNKFIMDPMLEQNLLGPKKPTGNITKASFKKTYIENLASKYHKLMAEKEANKTKTSKGKKEAKYKIPYSKTVPKNPETKKIYDDFEALKKRLFNMSVMKSGKTKISKTKEKPGSKSETRFRSQPNESQDGTEKTKVLETVGNKTDSIEKVNNEYEINEFIKQQENITEDTKSEESFHISDVAPTYRADLDALNSTGTKGRNIASTSILTKATEATSKVKTTIVVTTPMALKSSTTGKFISKAKSL